MKINHNKGYVVCILMYIHAYLNIEKQMEVKYHKIFKSNLLLVPLSPFFHRLHKVASFVCVNLYVVVKGLRLLSCSVGGGTPYSISLFFFLGAVVFFRF